jgi:hypothetical protein
LVLGSGTTNAQGDYTVNVGTVSLGTEVLVQASAASHLPVVMVGPLDEVLEQVDFVYYASPSQSDRRLPIDGGSPPPLPFDGLWPDPTP